METRNHDLKFVDYDNNFSDKLSTWIDIEQSQGLTGLKDFVVVGDVKLNEFLDFVQKNIRLDTKIAINGKNQTCGFVCYSETDKDHIHIECLGVNPTLRKMGIAKNLLISLKNKLTSENPDVSATLAVKKTNIAGLRSFSKVATEYEPASSENYVGLQL